MFITRHLLTWCNNYRYHKSQEGYTPNLNKRITKPGKIVTTIVIAWKHSITLQNTCTFLNLTRSRVTRKPVFGAHTDQNGNLLRIIKMSVFPLRRAKEPIEVHADSEGYDQTAWTGWSKPSQAKLVLKQAFTQRSSYIRPTSLSLVMKRCGWNAARH